ncbi:MAG TPA: HEAT repeat domain-containing protein [Anaeromyxobacter sp.]
MSATDPAGARARAAHADEETRYRAVPELDLADPADRGALLERLADPSWRVRSAAVERIARGPHAEVALPGLLEVLAGGPGVGAREAAAAALAKLGAPAVAPLVARLATADSDLRQAAAGVLGEIADRRAVPPLTAQLADPDSNVRSAIVDALGKIGGGEALEALRAAAESDDAILRLSAIEALAKLRASLATPVIERLLADRVLRRPLFRMVGASEDTAALPLLARGIADPSRAAREAALAALGSQRSRRELLELGPVLDGIRAAAARDPGLVEAWAAALESDAAPAALGALTALAAVGAARHAGAMVRLAEDERLRALVEDALDGLPPGPELREALAAALPRLGPLARITALAALARLGSPASFENVVREASDGSSLVQMEAIAALGRLRDARGVPPLAGLLGDGDAAAAGLAASALVRIAMSGEPERDAVLAAVRARAEAQGTAAAYRTLGAIGREEDLRAVLDGVRASGAAERAAAVAAVGTFAQRGHLPADVGAVLLEGLADAVWTVRVAAARAIADAARAGAASAELSAASTALSAAAAPRLVRLLRDPEHPVRAAAAEALGACGGTARAGDLAAVVLDPEAPPVVTTAALRALAALGTVPGEAIARALRHEDPEVVKAAVAAAGRLSGPDGARALRDAAESPRWDVRRAAAEAMRDRGDRSLLPDAERLAACDPDPLVARTFGEAARALGGR